MNHSHDYGVAETGYLADKTRPTAQYRVLYTGFLIDRWSYFALVYELHNSVPAQLSPFLGWVAYIFLYIKLVLLYYLTTTAIIFFII